MAGYDNSGKQTILEWITADVSVLSDAMDLALDDRGGLFVAGRTDGPIDGDEVNGGSDVYLAKYDRSGGRLWSELFGTRSEDAATNVALSSDGNVYVAGRTWLGLAGRDFIGGNYDGFLAKFDASGNREWVRQVGTSDDDQVQSLAVGHNGGIYLGVKTNGEFEGWTPSDGIVDDRGFLLKYDAAGDQEWVRAVGDDRLGAFSVQAISVGDAGHVYLAGKMEEREEEEADGYLAGYAPSGEQQWLRRLSLHPYGLVLRDRRFYVAGRASGAIGDQSYNGGKADGALAVFQ